MLNAKRFNAKNLSKCIFRASRKTFSYFRRLHWIMVGVPQYLLEFSLYYSVSSSSMQDLRWSSLWQKIWNGWKLFLTVATESFILYVAGFLELTQGIDNFRLRQKYSIQQLHVQIQQKKTLKMCHLYPRLTWKTPGRLLLLLSILNTFYTLFYCYYCWIRTNADWVWEYIVSDNKFVFSNYEKYIVLWAGKICWSTCFHLCSLKIRLWKDYISRQHLKKISQTLS